MMRIIVLALFAINFHLLAVNTYSQSTYLTLNIKEATIKNVLNNIQQNSEFFFIYDASVVNVQKNVSIKVKDKLIPEILDELFKGSNIVYKIDGHQIALTTLKASSAEVRQTGIIAGKVTDSYNDPLPGVTVMVKGSSQGTVTDMNGEYVLSGISTGAVLQYSFMGMKTQEVVIGSQTVINIVLQEDLIGLEEIVAIGYGTVKKSDLTGAVSAIKSEDFNTGLNTNIQQLFQGKIAGARVIQNTGEPGGGISMTIRGASSINAGTTPLYVIDGIPMDNTSVVSGGGNLFSGSFTPRSPLGTLNPNDIESIEILKDASASAIYGARAANGVALITTKTGRKGKLTINYDASAGIQNPSYKYALLSPQQYMDAVNAIIDAGGASEAERVSFSGKGTDWQEEIFNRNSFVTNHNLSISGGSENTSYLTSLSFLSQPGVIINNDFNRITARINIDHNINNILKLGIRLSNTYTDEKYIPYGSGYNEWAGVINSALNYDPTLPATDKDGKYSLSNWIAIDNPLAIANGINSKSNRYNTIGNFFAEYFIIPSLSAKINAGVETTSEFRKTYLSRLSLLGAGTGGTANVLTGNRSSYLLEGYLNYKKDFKDSSLSALLGATIQKFTAFNSNGSIANFPSDATGANNLGLGDPFFAEVNSNKSGYTLNSFFGRLNYSLYDRYLLTGTLRADGSSRFGKNNKYGIFPSVALGWKISNEKFMENITFLNSLKLRGSWGETGNQNIGNYQSLNTFQEGPKVVFGNNLTSTTASSRIPNPDLKWEKTAKTDIGVDFSILKNRIEGSADYFNQKTSDMLINLPVPKSTGYANILQNVGSMRNTGWEFTLITRNITHKSFTWETNINLTTLRNEVLDIGNIENIISGNNIITKGLPLRSFYGYQVIGTWQVNDDYSATKDDMAPGDYKFRDVNGDKIITADDRVILGNSFPKLTYGMTNSFSYKDFHLSFVIEGVSGIEKYNENVAETFNPINFRRNRIAEPFLNRWTPENPSNKYPSFVRPKILGDKAGVSSYTIMDASYIKLSSFQLAYDLIKRGRVVNAATIYLTGQNLLFISDFIGDPSIDTTDGVSDNAYPLPRIFTLGIKLSF
ncbi:MAG: TonB-dependent receptor [Tannerellaceae bacterium]|nr:TonB-dependent receptor [Tannerellaceae bacterium]